MGLKFKLIIEYIITYITLSKMSSLPNMCLNMIVKNEAHIIEDTLNSIYKYIDYYVINDTGSTDNTIEVIKTFFDKKGIKGEIYNEIPEGQKKLTKFHFGINRTHALNLCKNKSKYIFVMDADDIFVGDFVIPELTCDQYLIKIGNNFTYYRPLIFKNEERFNWRFIGSRHEYATGDSFSQDNINGNYYMDSRRLGNRSKNPLKYLDDAEALEEEYNEDNNNERAVFYIAQSYYDYGDIRKGIEWYRKRVEMGRWYEEVFYSYYRIATGLVALHEPWDKIEVAFLEAYTFWKRAEPLYEVAYHYRLQKNYEKGYKYAKLGAMLKYPYDAKLFVTKEIYDYKMLDELSLDAYYTNRYMESYLATKRALLSPDIPDDDRKRINCTLEFAQDKLKELDKNNCVVYGENNELLQNLTLFNNIYLVNNNLNLSKLPYNNVYNITIDQLTNIKTDITFSYVIMCDNLNIFLLDNFPLKCKKILFMSDSFFKYYLNGYEIILSNRHYLNNVLNKIDIIITNTLDTANKLKERYGLSDNILNMETNFDYCQIIIDNIRYKYVVTTNKTTKNNGFELMLPTYNTKNILINNAILESITDLTKKIPRSEILYYQYRQLCDMGIYVDAESVLNNAIKMCDTHTDNLDQYKDYLLLERASLLFNQKKYMESYKLSTNILNRNNITEEERQRGDLIKNGNIDFIQDNFIKYPTERIKKITKNTNKTQNYEIMLSITTCKRYDLFEKTINSFINCCDDVGKISCWLCVDDNSSVKDRNKMQKNYPFFTFIWKNESEKGHFVSMNMIQEFVLKHNVKYLLHMEDDFQFVNNRSYITDAIRILSVDQTYGQVLFNKNYMEVPPNQIMIPGGFPKYVGKLRYILHEHYKPGTSEYDTFVNKHSGYGTNAYWPHFSFRPSVINCEIYKKLGVFSNVPHFELQYANEYVYHGFVSTFFDDFCCIHIGKKTWETDKINSYNLNDTNQFVINKNNITVKIINNNLDKWASFKLVANNNLPHYEVIKQDTPNNIPDKYKILFMGNKFHYCRRIIKEYLCHLNTLFSFDTEYCMILYDCVEFNEGFKSSLNKLIENWKSDIDLYKLTSGPLELAYVIRKDAINKIDLIKEYSLDYNDISVLFSGMNIDICEIISGTLPIRDRIKYTELPGYQFYSQLDSYSGDIKYTDDRNIDTLKSLSDEYCGFNTNGWIKKVICNELSMIWLYNSTSEHEGLYVKNV
jgi:hypothetical protein